ncbi:MAG: FAD-dependent oxidoreductase [Acidobacteriaceae bacterium]
MSKPVILAVDDDPNVLEAVIQDLRRRYASEYRVLRAGSGQAGLDISRQLAERGDAVALYLSDQRMPGMSGVEFLERAQQIFPDARRALLTAYADTEAAIRAINSARIHYYLTKPWDPPEQQFYPVIDDLLVTWRQGYRPPYEGLKVIGPRWSLRDHEVRNFLSRNQVPYLWMDPEREDTCLELLRQHGLDDGRLPVVICADGTALVQPSMAELAEKVGLRTQAKAEYYDLVVVGAGPAGLGAAVYAASEGLSTLILEPEAPGGQAGSSSRIENYLGFPSGISGEDLARRAHVQATRFGAEFLTQKATGIRTENEYRYVQMADGREVSCRVCLLAMGVRYQKLGAPGVAELTGKGVYYGAALVEAQSCRDEEVFVVGGANSAGQAAMHFSEFARKVTMLVRASSLEQSMSKYLIDQIAGTSNIVVETNTEVLEACGGDRLESLRLRTAAGEETRAASALFIFIGAAPHTGWLPDAILRDGNGFVLTGPEMRQQAGELWKEAREPYLLETSMPGVFAAGDVRHGSVKRAATAVGEGAIAVQFVHQYLARY